MNLFNYLNDGASGAARTVLAHLSEYDGIENSWSHEWKDYEADSKIARWHNGREQGYIIYMRSKDFHRQINIAFFEHRNSDNICAIKWEQKTLNPPTIDTAEFGDIYRDKWDVSFKVSYNEAYKMAEWIYDQLTDFWNETSKKKGEQK